MSELVPTDDRLYEDVSAVLASARSAIVRSVNVEMVNAYWRIGGMINAHLTGDRSET